MCTKIREALQWSEPPTVPHPHVSMLTRVRVHTHTHPCVMVAPAAENAVFQVWVGGRESLSVGLDGLCVRTCAGG